jgi:DNA-binding phage protein
MKELEACLEEADGDAAFVAKALSGARTPNFETILKVVGALGIKLHAEAAPVVK